MLPTGYKLLEYIQSTGSQYVDTEFKPNQDTKVVLGVRLTDTTVSANNLFGARTSTTSNVFSASTVSTNYWRHGYNTSTVSTGVTIDGEKHEIVLDKNAMSIDGVVISTATEGTFTCPVSATIGRIAVKATTVYAGYAEFYYCSIYDNDTLIRQYVPCINPDGEVGLYDLVNNTFETDAAGGNFIAGPVVVSGIPAPENLTASITNGSVELTWDAVEDALFYTVLQDGIAIATTTETAYSGALVPFANTIYSVMAVNDEFESSPAETLVQYIPEEYDLITDRTSADVQRVKYLREAGWAAMTDDERTEFLSPLKGAYNASDLNRVEYAAKQLADRLNALPLEFREHAAALNVAWSPLFDVPYTPPSIETRYDWTVRDIPDADSMSRYLGNVTLLRGLLDYATAALPSSIDKLTYTGANAIEAALDGLFAAILSLQSNRLTLINNTAAAWFYSGEIYGGDV